MPAILYGLAAATAMGLMIATQHYMILSGAGRAIPWWKLAGGELPVWYTWLALYPAIRRLALRFPPLANGVARWRNLGVHLAAALASTLVMIVVTNLVRGQIGGLLPAEYSFWESVRVGFAGSFIAFLPIYGIILMGMVAWRLYQDAQERQLKESRLEAALASARLESLRDQLHPHFLFNTLHAISALMAEDVSGARKMMRRLSELLRIALEDGTHEVPLDDELRILDLYVGIQKIRFGDRLTVRYEVDPAARPMLVPRLLLQPIVENAIKHGTGGTSPEAVVRVRAGVEAGGVVMDVVDNGPGFPQDDGPRRYGIGLTNTRDRLETLYGADFTLETVNAPEGGARVRIVVPAREGAIQA